ncbi:MAG: DUF6132 family protein [Raineya sp.]|jgi:hypothetical protein|nr:DUF6132 family protein [Raineya sp.]
MFAFFYKNKLYVLGAVLGALAGYAYWYFVGCTSGTCAITSKPLNSTLYGSLMGMVGLGMFASDKPQTKH